MHKSFYGTVYYGEWKDGDACGEGAVVDNKGVTIAEGIFKNNWMKHRSKNI